MPFWRTPDEPSPQSRIGRRGPAPTHEPAERSGGGPASVARGIRLAIAGFVFAVALAVAVFLAVFLDGDEADSGRPAEGGGASLIRPDRLEPALAVVRREAGVESTIVALRLAPDRLDAVMREPGGGRTVVQIGADLDPTAVSAGSTGSSERGIGVTRIDPSAPERIVRRGARLVERDPGDVDYLALSVSPIDGDASWVLFFEGGAGAPILAGLDGSDVRLAGAP